MDESAVRLSQLSVSMSRVDEKVAETNTAISKFENLKKAPEMVKDLRRELDEEPSKLKKVYLESLKLEALQLALKKEGDYSQDTFNRINNAINNHLGIVPELVRAVRDVTSRDISQAARDKIHELFERKVEGEFESLNCGVPEDKISKGTAFIMAANHMFINAFEDQMMQRVEELLGDLTQLRVLPYRNLKS
eukprot:gene25259-33787_t